MVAQQMSLNSVAQHLAFTALLKTLTKIKFVKTTVNQLTFFYADRDRI